jgi:hypothetical protein
LPVTPAARDLLPAIVPQHAQHRPDFHADSVAAP